MISLRNTRRRFISVTGVKGGIGKSTISSNLVACFGRDDGNAAIVDGDMGLADLNLMFGVAPDRSLADVARGTPVAECLTSVHGVSLLPGLNGSYDLANADDLTHQRILAAVRDLTASFATVIVDAPAGLERNAIEMTSEAKEIIVVVTPTPTAIADAYGCCKVLHKTYGIGQVFLLVNDVRSEGQGQDVVAQMEALVSRFLPEMAIDPLPFVPHDITLPHYAAAGIPAVLAAPDAPGPRAILKVARALDLLSQDMATPHAANEPEGVN